MLSDRLSSAVVLLVRFRPSLPIVATLLTLLTASPALVGALLWMWLASICYHTLYIRPVLDILVKSAHWACDFFVFVHCKRKDRDEA